MAGIAYPRRTDAARYEMFDGTLESAQIIANLSGESVYMYLAPNRCFAEGDVVRLTRAEVGSRSVANGDYVVAPIEGEKPEIAIYSNDAFRDRFSRDGN